MSRHEGHTRHHTKIERRREAKWRARATAQRSTRRKPTTTARTISAPAPIERVERVELPCRGCDTPTTTGAWCANCYLSTKLGRAA